MQSAVVCCDCVLCMPCCFIFVLRVSFNLIPVLFLPLNHVCIKKHEFSCSLKLQWNIPVMNVERQTANVQNNGLCLMNLSVYM